MGKREKNEPMIETTVDINHNLTIQKCSGNLTTKEVIDVVNSFYDGSPTRHALWDFSNASMNNIPAENIRRIFTLIKDLGFARQGGKTAVVVPTDLGFGLARMFQIMSDTEDFPFKIKVFRYYGEARQWLLSEE
jgi:hypothetical protein